MDGATAIRTAYFDVWNEPNSQHKAQCMLNGTPPCVFDANLTQVAVGETVI